MFRGTQADNNADKIGKGRAGVQHGEAHWKAKLTRSDVAAIRGALALGESGAVLARQFGVGQALISKIKTGQLWRTL